jgi:hypothetical protein
MPLCLIQTKHMKNLLSLSAITFSLLLAACGSSGDVGHKMDIAAADVPASVMSSFTTAYPTATDVRWEKETENNMLEFEATFKQEDGKSKSVEFNEAGTLIKGGD